MRQAAEPCDRGTSQGRPGGKIGEDGGWIKIRYQGQEAWVYEDYMSEKNSRKEETKTETSKQTDRSADEKSETYHFGNAGEDQTD